MGKSLIIKNADFRRVSITVSKQDISSMFTWEDSYAIVGKGKYLGKKNNDPSEPKYDLLCASNYVNISKFTTLTLTALCRKSPTATLGLAFYRSADESSAISGIVYNNDEDNYKIKTITIPSEAVYIRTTFYKANKENFSCIAE